MGTKQERDGCAGDPRPPQAAAGPVALGVAEVDGALGGGLARGRLHEVVGEGADAAPAAGFAALLALRAAGRRTLVWVRQEGLSAETGRLYGPGLAELGIDPARLVVVSARDAAAGLRSGLEAVRCAALGAVPIELWGEPELRAHPPSPHRPVLDIGSGRASTSVMGTAISPRGDRLKNRVPLQ